ncbi:hypothetical protein FOCC_FOCC010921 [Frankliniella occidentalis]|nr:hypothetical protein FOCC_FOCC010921 [Frankliniella occidentalis]
MSSPCLVHVQSMSSPCPVHVQSMSNLCLVHAQSISLKYSIVNDSTDAEMYKSSLFDQNQPQYPYLLFTTSDQKTGTMFLKVDSLTVHVDQSGDVVLNGFQLLFKTIYAFNLQYHPYLKFLFQFFEYEQGWATKPIPSISALSQACHSGHF